MITEQELRRKLQDVVEECDCTRQLDSLEMMMIRLSLEAMGIMYEEHRPGPEQNTIEGWIQWQRQTRQNQ